MKSNIENPRNFIEAYTGKRLSWPPTPIGWRGGRRVYCLDFEDGTEADYYIEFYNEFIEEVE